MSESKHTPGPWKVLGRNVLAKKPFGYVCWCDMTKQKEQHEANARLIAAAPELLTATKECADALANIINAARNGQPYSVDELVKLFADIRCLGDEAVAKATGERI